MAIKLPIVKESKKDIKRKNLNSPKLNLTFKIKNIKSVTKVAKKSKK